MPGDSKPSRWHFRPLGDHRAELGESVFVSSDGLCVWWVDTTGQCLLRTHRETGATEKWPMPEQIGFVAEHAGHCLVGLESGLYRFDIETASLDPVPGTAPGPGMRYNDACIDAGGNLWTGTMALDGEQPAGTLLRLGPDMSLTHVASGFRRINGLAHHVSSGRLMFSDSHPQVCRIWSLALHEGVIASERHLVAELDADRGRPDGAALAPDGSYWIAMLEGSMLLRPAEHGRAAATIALPDLVATKVAWTNEGSFYVTSKQSSDSPWGGRLVVGTPMAERD